MHFGRESVVPQHPPRNELVFREDGWQDTHGRMLEAEWDCVARCGRGVRRLVQCNRCFRFSLGRSVCYSLNWELLVSFCFKHYGEIRTAPKEKRILQCMAYLSSQRLQSWFADLFLCSRKVLTALQHHLGAYWHVPYIYLDIGSTLNFTKKTNPCITWINEMSTATDLIHIYLYQSNLLLME